jgi:hypothetical protein
MRITAGIESLNPIWGLQFDPANGDALRWIPSRIISHAYNDLIKALIFGDPRYKPL